jgi:hypothetical protein
MNIRVFGFNVGQRRISVNVASIGFRRVLEINWLGKVMYLDFPGRRKVFATIVLSQDDLIMALYEAGIDAPSPELLQKVAAACDSETMWGCLQPDIFRAIDDNVTNLEAQGELPEMPPSQSILARYQRPQVDTGIIQTPSITTIQQPAA